MKLHAKLTALLLSCALLGLSACQASAPDASDLPGPSPVPAPPAVSAQPEIAGGGEPADLYFMCAGEDWLTADLDGDGQEDTIYAVSVPTFDDLGGYAAYFDGMEFGGVTQLSVSLSGSGNTVSVIFPPDGDWWGRDWPALSAGNLAEGEPPYFLLTRQDRTSNYGAADLHLFRITDGELEEVMDSRDFLALAGDALLVGGEIDDGWLLADLYLCSGMAALGVRVRFQPDASGEWICTLDETPQYAELTAQLDRALSDGDGAALYDGFFCPEAFLPWADGLVPGDLSRLVRLVAQEVLAENAEAEDDYMAAVFQRQLECLGGLAACQPYQGVLDALEGAVAAEA